MLRKVLQKAYRWAQSNSIWVLHYNTGGCNGCDIEILDLLTPRYDVERLGILAEASPRQADVLLCTGPVTRQSAAGLLQIYEQMPSPKWVVAVGACSTSGGVFAGSDTILGGVDQVLPVDLYVPGCACRPEAIIAALVQLKAKIEKGAHDEHQ
ncbi:MAG: NADH-quinone oxidoreductase subunit B family protein [Anaerolineae bacterium]|jgi:NADH-quinone oxidoreductase B subunit|nr:NADH-quinone oxidoreductase subunit B family protein [Anaerolineae bacterium]